MTAAANSAAQAAIEVTGLRKAFGAQQVLDGVDLAVAPGETVSILGQSGTGKSVLLKRRPAAGAVECAAQAVRLRVPVGGPV
jgi:ABC-type transporter Mla maintaining outer membrane lipid asymmetry ATPase subunit MlaF